MAKIVSPGSSFFKSPFNSAAVQNDLLKMREEYQARRLGEGGGHAVLPRDRDTIKVKNTTGADWRGGEVVEIGPMLLDEIDRNNWWFSGLVPTSSANTSFAILTNPIKDSKIGEAVVAGTVVALVYVTNANHKFAIVKEGEKVLQSAATGPVRILHKAASSGEVECEVIVDPPRPNYGVAVLSSELSAADFTSDRIYGSGFTTMPTVNAAIYVPQHVSGGWKFGSFTGTAQPIFNPHPFVWTEPNIYLWVREANGAWLVDRHVDWTPHAKFNTSTLTGSAFEWGTQAPAYGNLATSAGTTITITCPVFERLFRVKWSFSATGTASGTSTWSISSAINLGTGSSFLSGIRNGSASQGTATAGGDSVLYTAAEAAFSGEFIAKFSKNETFTMTTSFSGVTSLTSRSATILIEPMF